MAGLTSDTHIGAVLMAGGLAAGLLAMGAGRADLIRLDQEIIPHAMRHAAVVGLAWVGYGIALYLRKDALTAGTTTALGAGAIGASLASALVLAVGGWLGGRLVYTFGANVVKS